MTTIAYKDGVMACDSRWSYNDAVDSVQTKIRRLASGGLIGGSGDNDAREIEALFDKVKTPAGLPKRTELMNIRCDYLGLLVLPRGRIFKVASTHLSEAHWGADFEEDIGVWEINAPFAAVGSGKEFALGAMAAGKSAADACRIACRFDINSGLPVYQYDVKPPAKKK
jgi:hypothetical protein